MAKERAGFTAQWPGAKVTCKWQKNRQEIEEIQKFTKTQVQAAIDSGLSAWSRVIRAGQAGSLDRSDDVLHGARCLPLSASW